jgi:peroxiredoxin
MFSLPDATRDLVALSKLLRKGPVVISFFWGAWSPFCSLALEELARADAAIRAEGATLIGVSPHMTKSETQSSARHLPLLLLHDAHCKVAKQYGLTFFIPQANRAAYSALGYPGVADGPSNDWLLSIPATYLIEASGRILFSYLDANCRTGFEPSEIIVALRGFRRRAVSQLMSRSRGG